MAVGKFAVPASATGGGGGGTLTKTLRTYTSGDTWSKPSGLQHIEVLCCGGGGSGGSGSTAATSTVARAGGGGGGASCMGHQILAAALGSTVTVTIGAGATGAAGVSANSTAGTPGGAGGDTSFGTHVVAKGGNGGVATGSAQNLIGSGTPAYGSISYPGGIGSQSSATGGGGTAGGVQNVAAGATNWAAAIMGAAGGGGLGSANTIGVGGVGNRYYKLNGTLTTAVSTGTGAGLSGQNGTDNVWDRLLPQFFRDAGATVTIGSSGSGGNGQLNGNAGNGGNGGLYGASGSGGGSARNGFTSGAGGNGSGGFCLVLEYTIT